MDHHDDDDSEEINGEWQRIERQSSSPETSPTTLHQSTTLGWDMVAVNDNYLHVDQSSSEGSSETVPMTTTDREVGSSPPSADSAAAPPPSDWRLRIASEGRKMLKLRLEAARNGVVRVAAKVRDLAVCAGAFWSVTCVAGAAVAAVLVAVAFVEIRRQRRRRTADQRQSVEHLVYLLREKDEKISQLLLQIAQLNEVMSSRRKVPVLRISS